VKGLTSTIALTAVLAGLGAYIYFVDSKKPASDTPVKEKVFAVDAGAIAEFTVKAADGESTTVRKGPGGWQVVAPVQAAADANEPSSITSSLATLELNRVVDENPASVADFGLDPARMEIAFTVSGAQAPKRLLIGVKTPPGTDVYARRPGESRVFLIPASVENTFNRTTFDLRDKSVVKADRMTLDSLELTAGGSTLRFARRNEVEWNIVAPRAVRGDFGAIDGLISALSSAQVQKFIANEAADAPEYGFATPTASVTLAGDGKQAVLTIGAEVDGTLYARDSTRPLVFTVGANLAADLKKPLEHFRRKDVFDFRVFNVARVEFALGADTLWLEKTKTPEGPDTWKTGSGKTLEVSKAEESMLKFSNMKAATFVTAVPVALKTPLLTVTATLDDGKTVEVVRFAKSGADVYAVRQDDPGAATLPAAVYDEAVKALDALR